MIFTPHKSLSTSWISVVPVVDAFCWLALSCLLFQIEVGLFRHAFLFFCCFGTGEERNQRIKEVIQKNNSITSLILGDDSFTEFPILNYNLFVASQNVFSPAPTSSFAHVKKGKNKDHGINFDDGNDQTVMNHFVELQKQLFPT